MNKLFLNKNYIFYIILAVFSFYINFYVGSFGVFPVDTFIHYDNGYRILLGEHPIKDYWIVHGFLIDYIQAFFFKFFGNEWKSYLYHSSIFNSCITLFSFYTFKLLKINNGLSFFLSISIALLAYPVSGTPFLDLHSSYFSLFAIYFGIIALKKDKKSFWFWTSFFLCLAFLCKQVPAGYTIVLVTLLVLYLSFKKNKFYIISNYALGTFSFLSLLFLFLLINETSIKDFILQIFLFPSSIGSSRYETYSLGFKNIFIDYKFIYIVFLSTVFFNLKEYFKSKKKNEINFSIFLLLSIIVVSSIFHQIHTKNQIYIFFLIPICSGFAIFYNNLYKVNFKKWLNSFIILICVFSTFKYYERFNINRKFHELTYTNISNSVDGSKINEKFRGLNWISPYFKNPDEEIYFISSLIKTLSKERKVMLITQYNFFSSITEKKLFSPSRTYDLISYPRVDTKYYNLYKKHLISIIKSNKITKIFIFEPNLNINLDEIIFNYVPQNCFTKKVLNKHVVELKKINCKEI